VVIGAPGDLRTLLEKHREDLRALLIVSDVRIADAAEIGGSFKSADIAGLAVSVGRAAGVKCDRCWIYSETVGVSAEHPTICARCRENL
jgi:isoleucyl-tRNA synthetase